MRSALACASVALAAWLLAPAAFAQTVARPVVKVGDQWQFTVSTGSTAGPQSRVWVVTAITQTAIEGTENGAPLRLSGDLGVLDSPRTQDSNPAALSFPLAPGKVWRYATNWVSKVRNAAGTATYDVAVVTYERIRVPAGDFDAYRITSKADMQGAASNVQLDADVESTYWYAPAARAIVRSVTTNPYVGTVTVELAGYRLQP